MQSANPGHMLDATEELLCNPKTEYILWGAANIGRAFIVQYSHMLHVRQVVDGGHDKQGGHLLEHSIGAPTDIEFTPNAVVVVTCSFYNQIRPILEQKGFQHKVNLFDYETFDRFFAFFSTGYLRSGRIDISLTEQCTLKCKNCNMFMTHFKNPKAQPLSVVKEDIDAYFAVVDYVRRFNVLGGEPMLYKELALCIEYIGQRYRNRIETLTLFTNGMILPGAELLALYKKYDVTVQFSDYTAIVPYQDKISAYRSLLDNAGITHYTMPVTQWSDFGFPDNPNNVQGDAALTTFFDRCCPDFRGLWNKRVYFCHLETSAIRAGMFTDNANDYFALETRNPADIQQAKRRFLEFDFGYNLLGYVTFCKVCRGCGCVNDLVVPVAEQM